MNQSLLHLDGLTKSYPGVTANDKVSFEICAGEIHALLGENGAGKSTLVKMIYGLVRPDTGQMLLESKIFTPSEPRAARAQGIAMVFQHFSLFEALSVAENIALGMEKPPKSNALSKRILEVSNAYGLPLDPQRLVGDLSAGERQRVEIIRCLLQDPKLLIMDEPTSVLTPQEVTTLFTTLRKLKSEGTSILYISHKLEEIRALCETATILRNGKKVATCDPRDKSARELAEMMVGASLKTTKADRVDLGDVVFEISNLSLPPQSAFGTSLRNISFQLHKGEILGIGGVAGNGQDELLACLSGEVLQDPIVLIVNQPTWGVDAAAAASIRQSLLDLASNGAAIVVISQDLDELIEISTCFAALNAGKLSDTQPMAKISLDEIGLMLGGANAAA